MDSKIGAIMKKLIKGALDKLMGGEFDPSKRNLIKGAGALGAIAVTPKIARKVAGEAPVPRLKNAIAHMDSSFKEHALDFSQKMKNRDEADLWFDMNLYNDAGTKTTTAKLPMPKLDLMEMIGKQTKVDTTVPKFTDLKSFRDSDLFQKQKDLVSTNVKILFPDKQAKVINEFAENNVVEMYDDAVYSNMPNSDWWDDVPASDVKAMVNELQAEVGLKGDEIVTYFNSMGRANDRVIGIVEALVE